MRKFLTMLVLVPLGIIFVVFAVANRHMTTVSFDPFNTVDPAASVTLPLFAVIIGVAIFGVIAGGVATWFGQRHWRRAARRHEAEATQARIELADWRGNAAPLAVSSRLPAVLQPGGSAMRDKPELTL